MSRTIPQATTVVSRDKLPARLAVSDADKYVYIVGNLPTQNSHWDNLQVKREDDFEVFGQEGLPADCGALVLHGRVGSEHRKRLIDLAESAGVICVAPDNFQFEELNQWLKQLDIDIVFLWSEEADEPEEPQTIHNPPFDQRVKVGDNQEGEPVTEYTIPFFGDPSGEGYSPAEESAQGAGASDGAGKQATTENGAKVEKQGANGMKERFLGGKLTVKGLIKQFWLECGEGNVGLLTQKAHDLGMKTSRATMTSQKSDLLRHDKWIPPKAESNGNQPMGLNPALNGETAQPDAPVAGTEQVAAGPEASSLPVSNEPTAGFVTGSLPDQIAAALAQIQAGLQKISEGQDLVAKGSACLLKAQKQAEVLAEFAEFAKKVAATL